MENREAHIITIYSPKGGTGKTTLAVQLAYAYARQSKKVLLIDAAQFGNIGTVLKMNMKSTGFGNIISFFEFADTGDISEQLKAVKESIQVYNDDLLEFDVVVSALPLKMEELDADRIKKTINISKIMGYDYIIIDTSSDLSLRNLEAMSLSHEILLLCEQDVSCVWNVILLKDIIYGLDLYERLKLVIMKHSRLSGLSIEEIETETGLLVFWVLPQEKAIRFYNNQKAGLCKRREKYALKVKEMSKFMETKFLSESRCER